LYQYELTHPQKPSPAMILGNAAHCAVLTPHLYPLQFAVAPSVDRRTKEGKATWEQFLVYAASQTVLTSEQSDTVLGMVAALERNPDAWQTMKAGLHEVSVVWEIGNRKCKARLDAVDGEHGLWVADFKTIGRYPSPRAIQSAMFDFKYHVQFAWYRRAVAAQWGTQPTCFAVFQMTKPPYTSHLCHIAPAALDRGDELIEQALARIDEIGKDSPTPVLDFPRCTTLDLPPWGYRDDVVEVVE
jgi:exodeoxyribonuclease VIII